MHLLRLTTTDGECAIRPTDICAVGIINENHTNLAVMINNKGMDLTIPAPIGRVLDALEQAGFFVETLDLIP